MLQNFRTHGNGFLNFPSSIGNAVSYKPTTDIPFPTLSACLLSDEIKIEDQESLVDTLNATKAFAMESFLSVKDQSLAGPDANLLDKDVRDRLGYSEEDLFHGYVMIVMEGPPSYCVSYVPPKMSHMGVQYKVRYSHEFNRQGLLMLFLSSSSLPR